jgi:NAD(P)-dependent dehydrogenase (short-subunit alcohol dehydrogenase family)
VAQRRLAIVTGANRGIGLEVVRQLADLGYTVVLGSRDLGKGEAAAKKLKAGDRVMARRLDVTDQSDIDRLRDEIAEASGSLDVLVNNAAIHYDTWEDGWAVELHDGVPTGGFFRDGRPVRW